MSPPSRPVAPSFESVSEALEQLRNGKMVILVDDEDRENFPPKSGGLPSRAEFDAATPYQKGFLAYTYSQWPGSEIPSANPFYRGTVEAEEFAAGEYLSVAVYDRGGERYPKINESLDFIAFFHKPRYALVEVAPVIPQRTEPGRAPARPGS